MVPLAEAVRKGLLRGLTALRLSNNRLGDPAVAAVLAAMSDGCKAYPTLTHLELSNTGCGALAAERTALAMRTGALAWLQHLDMSFNFLAMDGVAALAETMGDDCCPHMRVLRLACNSMRDKGLHSLCRCLKTCAITELRELDIANNQIGSAVQQLARVLNSGVCPQLQRLSLSGNINELPTFINLFHLKIRRQVRIV